MKTSFIPKVRKRTAALAAALLVGAGAPAVAGTVAAPAAHASVFTFQSAGTKQVQLTVTNANSAVSSVEHDVTVGTGGGGGGLLTWSPPACGGADGLACQTINLTNTGGPQNPSLASNVDYKIVLPSVPLTGGTLKISGGHNVIVIGGEIDLVNPCSDSGTACPGQANGAIYVNRTTPGEVYLEGIRIHNTQIAADTGATCPGGGTSCSTADGIDVNTEGTSTPPTIVMQNMLVDGISGCSGGADHADVLQPYQAGGSVIEVDHFTGTTNCQGFQIDPDLSSGNPPNYTIKNANIDVLNNPYSGNHNRYAWWLTAGTGCPSGSIGLTNAYAQEPDGARAANSVWPDTDQPVSCKSVWNGTTGQLSFPNSAQITGVINEGLPAGGDYVTGGGTGAGTGYVSPGYQ